MRISIIGQEFPRSAIFGAIQRGSAVFLGCIAERFIGSSVFFCELRNIHPALIVGFFSEFSIFNMFLEIAYARH
jgi:hypothetical protein